MWNMQSGLKRKDFNIGLCPPEVVDRFRPSTTKKGSDRCVTGLASDSLNRVVIASTLDGTINVCLYERFHWFGGHNHALPVLRLSFDQIGAYISAPFDRCVDIIASR